MFLRKLPALYAGVLILVTAFVMALPQAATAQRYTLVDLGVLNGPYSSAMAVNDHGQVTGTSWAGFANGNTLEHAFLYSSGMRDLGVFKEPYSYGRAIDSTGRVAGYSNAEPAYYHAFLYANGMMTDLGTLGGVESFAYAMNDAGQVAGFSRDASGYGFPFLNSGGVMSSLGTLGGNSGTAFAINSLGAVGGGARGLDVRTHSFGPKAS